MDYNCDLQRLIDWLIDNHLILRAKTTNQDKRLKRFAIGQFDDPLGFTF